MTTTPQPHAHLQGRLKVVVQVVWLILVGLILSTFAAGIPVRLSHLLSLVGDKDTPLVVGLPPALEAAVTSRLGPEEAGALQSLGLSPLFYAGYILTFDVALVLVCAVIGLLIFWRRSDDWMALWMSLIVVVLGTNAVSNVVPTLTIVWPGWGLMSIIAGLLGMISNVHILFLSPDGRWVPRWTLSLAAGFTGGMLALALYIVMVSASGWGSVGLVLFMLALPVWSGLLAVGVFSQIYRYRWFSDPVRRQQTKWVVVGLAAVALGFGMNVFFLSASSQQSGLARLLYNLARAPIVNLCMLFLPICLGYSIFRYRLWDIDVIIRRTLIYSVLSSLLALTYFVLIVVLQSFIGPSQTQLVTVLSTLGIAVLVLPLRRRVQDFIDRRFFRKKYDAQKVLANFATTARDETDLEKLTARLVDVVDETMQPESVSLWLKKPEPLKQREH
jgi:hypothetical protein